jgi:hypothetical protein
MLAESGEEVQWDMEKTRWSHKESIRRNSKKPVNPEPGQAPISLEDVGLDAPNVRRRRGRAVKTFNQWIENEPKEKWCLLHSTRGVRFGIKTTNFAEVYNAVLHGAGVIHYCHNWVLRTAQWSTFMSVQIKNTHNNGWYSEIVLHSNDCVLLTVKIRQPSHEFTFGVGMSFIPYPLVLTPVV